MTVAITAEVSRREARTVLWPRALAFAAGESPRSSLRRPLRLGEPPELEGLDHLPRDWPRPVANRRRSVVALCRRFREKAVGAGVEGCVCGSRGVVVREGGEG